jgi:hypothetical protein
MPNRIRRKRPAPKATLPALPSQELPPAIRLHNKTAMLAEWADPGEGATHSATRSAKKAKGLSAFDPLRRLNGMSGIVSAEHVAAADQLRLLHDGSRIGFSAERDWSRPIQALLYRPSTGPSQLALKQARCGRGLAHCMRVFSAGQQAMIEWIILGNRSLRSWQQAHAMTPAATRTMLLAILDELVRHFDDGAREVWLAGLKEATTGR